MDSSIECMGLCGILALGPLTILAGMCCLIASLSTSYWIEDTSMGIYNHGGLFEVCYEYGNRSGCNSWDDSYLVDDTVYAKLAIAALILACIAYLLGFFFMSCFVISTLDGSGGSLGGNSTWGTAIVLNTTGIGMFVNFQNQPRESFHPSIIDDYDYGYSFHLSWICIVLVVIGCGVTLFVGFCCMADYEPEGGEVVPVEGGNQIREGVYAPEPQPDQTVSFVNLKEDDKA